MKRALCVLLVLLLLLAAPLGTLAREDGCYALGDPVEDFTLTTSDGEQVSLYGLLQEHQAVLLNFWFAGCGPCYYEFPFLDNAARQWGDQVAVLAVSPYDDDETIRQYKAAMGLSIPMASDTFGITDLFVDYGFPTSVVIDRNGIICYMDCGAQSSTDSFLRLLSPFLDENYDVSVLLTAIPRIPMPDPPEETLLDALLNVPGGTLHFTTPGGVWPWIPGPEGLYAVSSNAGADDTLCMASAEIGASAGDALSFRLSTSTEEGYDLFGVIMDGEIVKLFSGENPWQRYAVPFTSDGMHTVSFIYTKNDMEGDGEDQVALTDVMVLRGRAAERALSGNPTYPLTMSGTDASLEFLDENARQIVFDDPDGDLAAFYGAEAYYLLSGDSLETGVQLGADCDPDAAFIRALDGSAVSLSHCDYDQDGFLFTAPSPMPGLGWNALMIFPSIADTNGAYTKVYLYFESEEALDSFCATQVPDLWTGEPADNITWDYAEP